MNQTENGGDRIPLKVMKTCFTCFFEDILDLPSDICSFRVVRMFPRQSDTPPDVIYKEWEDTLSTIMKTLPTLAHAGTADNSLILITTYNRGNPPIQKIITKLWPFL